MRFAGGNAIAPVSAAVLKAGVESLEFHCVQDIGGARAALFHAHQGCKV